MKLLPAITAVAITVASFSALAATPISEMQAQSGTYQSLGMVSVSAPSTIPGSLHDQLNQIASDKGASHYRVIGADAPGDSSLTRASVELYK
ncbi:DUF1471 domain-containing protein [Rahnella sp. C60]|uniref:DUF1471 domain-containing protein n=1 Tax=Rahnella perminowiae TaxID=2816244 RepID=UPI001C258DD1|nr:DUF1471 domain-containing protein [Rahnella perminowiae]MBU9816085.1 DUF1471 domain-containing protein [Rahnella perminowiae]